MNGTRPVSAASWAAAILNRMSLRTRQLAKIRARVEPLLEPGEQLEDVIKAFEGWGPPAFFIFASVFGYVFWVLFPFFMRPRILAMTTTDFIVFKADPWMGTRPRRVLTRLQRSARRFRSRGVLFRWIQLGEVRLWVIRASFKEVDALGLPVERTKLSKPLLVIIGLLGALAILFLVLDLR